MLLSCLCPVAVSCFLEGATVCVLFLISRTWWPYANWSRLKSQGIRGIISIKIRLNLVLKILHPPSRDFRKYISIRNPNHITQ